jgi:hypothetical protein
MDNRQTYNQASGFNWRKSEDNGLQKLETEVTGFGPVVNIRKSSQRSSWTLAPVEEEEEDMKWINSAFLCKTEYENVTSYDITKPMICSNEWNLKIIGDHIRD